MKVIQKCCIGGFFLIAGLIYLIFGRVKPANNQSQKLEDVSKAEAIALTNIPTIIMTEDAPFNKVVVHVCGCVKQPGVYELIEGSRLIDAVKLAGGFTSEAAQDFVNQAKVITDGQKIEIPSVEEVKAGFVVEESIDTQAGSDKDGRININLASKEELMTLPGIGEAKAQSIIAYREEQHGFQTIDDIKLIIGIKEAIYSKVKDLIKVE